MLLSLYNSSIAYARQNSVLSLADTQSHFCYTVHINYTVMNIQVDRLHTALIEVVKTACECNADSSLYPKEWLFHFRWVNGKKKNDVPKDFYGNTIKFETIGSRTSAVVEAVVGKAKLKAAPAKANANKKRTTKVSGSAATDTTTNSDSEQEEAAVVKKARTSRTKKADTSSAAAVVTAADASSETQGSKAVKSTGSKRKRAVKAVQESTDASIIVATESKHFSKITEMISTDDTGTDTVGTTDEPQQPSKKKAAGKRTAKKSSGN
jgi:hypothetical protein